MLLITPQVRNDMFAHALRELPNEACGMFSTLVGVDLVDYFHPMRNIRDSATVFALDGQQMLDLEREVEQAGRQLVGVMHSHTETSAYPSPTDVRDSAGFDPFGTFRQVIVSLRDSEPVLRCFTIKDDEITEVLVVVSNGSQDAHDDAPAAAVAQVRPLRSADRS